MTNISENKLPDTSSTESNAQAKVEFIPYHLHLKQVELHNRLAKTMADVAGVLHNTLHAHYPKSGAFKKAQSILARLPMITSDITQMDAIIEAARRAANESLYGIKEPNKPLEETNEQPSAVEPAPEGNVSDSTSGN